MSIKKNFIYNTTYQVFSILLPIITIPYISRVLGAEGVGLYSYTSAYTQYFIILGMLGISMYGRRQIAYSKCDSEKLNKDFWNIYSLQLITTSTAFFMYILLFVILNESNKIIYFIQSILIVSAIMDISWLFIGLEDLKNVVVKNFIIRAIGVIAIFIFVKTSEDLLIYALIMATTNLFGQAIMWLYIKGRIKFYRPQISEIKHHLKISLGLFISQLAIQVYILLDRTMLGIFTDNFQVGIYDNSQKTIKVILTVVTSLGVVMLPRMSVLYSEGKIKEFKNLIYKTFEFVNLISIPMVLGLMLTAEKFSVWFYGPEFAGIQDLLRVGSLIILAISWSNILGIQVMLPMRKEKQFTLSVVAGAVINLLLNIVLITKFKSMGTTISSVAAELTVTLVQLYFLRKIIDVRIIIKSIYKPLIAGMVMYLAVKSIAPILPINIMGTLVEVTMGGIMYIVMIYLLKHELVMEYTNQIKRKLQKRKCSNE